jgi:HEAT repeat protein
MELLLRGIGQDSPVIYTVQAWAAAAALRAIGSAASIPAVQQCLGMDTGDELIALIKLSAAVAIWRISGDTVVPLRVAGEMLEHAESNIQCATVELLGTLGPAARPAIGDLQRLLEDSEEAVQQCAAKALAKIG